MMSDGDDRQDDRHQDLETVFADIYDAFNTKTSDGSRHLAKTMVDCLAMISVVDDSCRYRNDRLEILAQFKYGCRLVFNRLAGYFVHMMNDEKPDGQNDIGGFRGVAMNSNGGTTEQIVVKGLFRPVKVEPSSKVPIEMVVPTEIAIPVVKRRTQFRERSRSKEKQRINQIQNSNDILGISAKSSLITYQNILQAANHPDFYKEYQRAFKTSFDISTILTPHYPTLTPSPNSPPPTPLSTSSIQNTTDIQVQIRQAPLTLTPDDIRHSNIGQIKAAVKDGLNGWILCTSLYFIICKQAGFMVYGQSCPNSHFCSTMVNFRRYKDNLGIWVNQAKNGDLRIVFLNMNKLNDLSNTHRVRYSYRLKVKDLAIDGNHLYLIARSGVLSFDLDEIMTMVTEGGTKLPSNAIKILSSSGLTSVCAKNKQLYLVSDGLNEIKSIILHSPLNKSKSTPRTAQIFDQDHSPLGSPQPDLSSIHVDSLATGILVRCHNYLFMLDDDLRYTCHTHIHGIVDMCVCVCRGAHMVVVLAADGLIVPVYVDRSGLVRLPSVELDVGYRGGRQRGGERGEMGYQEGIRRSRDEANERKGRHYGSQVILDVDSEKEKKQGKGVTLLGIMHIEAMKFVIYGEGNYEKVFEIAINRK